MFSLTDLNGGATDIGEILVKVRSLWCLFTSIFPLQFRTIDGLFLLKFRRSYRRWEYIWLIQLIRWPGLVIDALQIQFCGQKIFVPAVRFWRVVDRKWNDDDWCLFVISYPLTFKVQDDLRHLKDQIVTSHGSSTEIIDLKTLENAIERTQQSVRVREQLVCRPNVVIYVKWLPMLHQRIPSDLTGNSLPYQCIPSDLTGNSLPCDIYYCTVIIEYLTIVIRPYFVDYNTGKGWAGDSCFKQQSGDPSFTWWTRTHKEETATRPRVSFLEWSRNIVFLLCNEFL